MADSRHRKVRSDFQRLGTYVILLGVLCLSFWVRVQGVERIPIGQFTETDAYLYYKQAETIAKHGHLPERDMDRWMPLGRDNEQLLPLYPYAIAYAHKLVPWVSLYEIQRYAPTLCFTLGLGVLMLFLTRSYGIFFAGSVGILLATLPGSVERSAAGFGDRDAWCWFFGVLAVTGYLWKEQMAPGRSRYLVTAFAGAVVFFGGMSWEAFGVFVLIVLATELWKFCSTDTETYLSEYVLWTLMFVPGLYIISPAYHSGYGFATHIFALTLAPPIALLVLRGTRYLLLLFFKTLHPHAKKLSCGLTFLGIAIGIGYLFLTADSLATTTFAFHENRLMQSVTELANPSAQYWGARYGTVFGLGSIGLVFGCSILWRTKNTLDTLLNLLLSLLLFAFIWIVFWPESLGYGNSETIRTILLGLIMLTFGVAAWRNTAYSQKQSIFFTFLVWFLFWVSLASSGKRYDFFTGIPFAFGMASLLWALPTRLMQRLKDLKILNAHLKEQLLTRCMTIALFTVICFYAPLGGYVTRTIPAAAHIRSPIPEQEQMIEMFKWINSEVPKESVLAALWDFGTQLNVFCGVKTVTDPDHFIPHWIVLYYRYVLYTQSEREALEYLKTHQATHLILTETEVIRQSKDFSYIGSDSENDRYFKLVHLVREDMPIGSPYRLRPHRPQETSFDFIDITQMTSKVLSVSMQFTDGTRVDKEVRYEPAGQNQVTGALMDGGLLLQFDTENRLQTAYYIPFIGWNSLAVKLFLRREQSAAFRLIYPTDADTRAKVKIWKIDYPSEIKTDDKYLATQPSSGPDESRADP